MRSSYLFTLIALTTVIPMRGQPTNGPVYWSTNASLDCTSLNEATPVPVTNASGNIIGYSCSVSGTFVWFAAGGGWATSLRVAAPATVPGALQPAAIGVDYTFYDQNGNPVSLDTTVNNVSSSLASGSEVDFALSTNQPAEVEILGATSNAPTYKSTADGTVYAVFLCPDAATCGNVLPQLLYSALPMEPWSLSVPLAFDQAVWTQWSAVGINNPGQGEVISLAIYNEDIVANTYKISVFDSNGNLVGSGTTPSIPALQNLGNGNYGEGGTYGVLLSNVVPNLPQGILKVLVDGGSYYSAVEVLQVNGPSATTLQVAYDSSPAASAAVRRAALRRLHAPSAPKPAFPPLPHY
jgi:hypothetical protein